MREVAMTARHEDLLLLLMLIVVGAIPVLGAFFDATPWGAQPAIGGLMMLFAIIELIRERRP